MASIPLFWQLPPELRLIIYDFCGLYGLAKLARCCASPNTTAYRQETEYLLYRCHLLTGNHAALLGAIEMSRDHPAAAHGTIAKLRTYGQFHIGGDPMTAFERDLDGVITTKIHIHTYEESILVTAARIGHPSLFRTLFEARFLIDASSNEYRKPREITLDRTRLVSRRGPHNPPELTAQRPDMTALGYAFRRSLSTEPHNGPEMLHTVLDCARLLARQLAEEGASLQACALNGSITLDKASEVSVDLGIRSHTAYHMGHTVSFGLGDQMTCRGPSSTTILTALAWFGDDHGLLPRLLRDYRALVKRTGVHLSPLLSAIGSGSKKKFDLIMDLGDIDPNMRETYPPYLSNQQCTPIMMAVSTDWVGDLVRGCPAWKVYATRLEMLKTLLDHGADPNLDVGPGPLMTLVRQLSILIEIMGDNAFWYVYQVMEALLEAGADPSARGPWGSCAILAILEAMHSQRNRPMPSPYSQERTEEMLKGEKTMGILGQILQQVFEHRPEFLTASIPGANCSAVEFAVSQGNHQLADYLRSLGAC